MRKPPTTIPLRMPLSCSNPATKMAPTRLPTMTIAKNNVSFSRRRRTTATAPTMATRIAASPNSCTVMWR